jgi:hypothetical protein
VAEDSVAEDSAVVVDWGAEGSAAAVDCKNEDKTKEEKNKKLTFGFFWFPLDQPSRS